MNVSGNTNVFQRDLDIIYGPIKGRSIANICKLRYLIKAVSVVTMALLVYVVIVSKLYLLLVLLLTSDW